MLTKAERFASRIKESIRIDGNGCWIWRKSKSWNGYGRFATGGGGNARAHRISYAVFIGPIPAGLEVCHKCDVRSCVNPDHLFVGSRTDNLQDASRKGRLSRTHGKKGSAHPAAKLTEDQIDEILILLAEGKPKAEIGRLFGVTDRIILLIHRGELWKHVLRPLSHAADKAP